MSDDEIKALRAMYEGWGYGNVRGYLDAWDDEDEAAEANATPGGAK